jgi:hypothetical protein
MESKPRRFPGKALAKFTRRIGTSKEDKASVCAPAVQAFLSGDHRGELSAAVRKLSAVWQRLGEARMIRTVRTLKQLMAGLPDHSRYGICPPERKLRLGIRHNATLPARFPPGGPFNSPAT